MATLRLPACKLPAGLRKKLGVGSGPNKYHAKIPRDPATGEAIRCDRGLCFHSTREYRRYCQLLLLKAAGAVTGLRRQVTYPLVVGEYEVGVYVADFTYREYGKLVVEDTKGVRTEGYLLKRNLMLALHGVSIRET